MYIKRVLLIIAVCMTPALSACGLDRGDTFDNVVKVLEKGYFDSDFRNQQLQQLASEYRDQAAAAETDEKEREVIYEFLSEIPASHLQLISQESYNGMIKSLTNKEAQTFGFELIHLDDGFYVHTLYEGGPAAVAGVLQGDRVIFINGEKPEASEHLDWRTDDASLPDPPIHDIRLLDQTTIELRIEREPGQVENISIESAMYSAFEAAKASAKVVERDGKKIAYIHFWFIHMFGPDKLLVNKFKEEFQDVDGFVLDLRGRGGSASMVAQLIQILDAVHTQRGLPIVALIDDLSRSAKEAIAYDLREQKLAVLVGSRTAGALLPAGFKKVGGGAVLMYPSFRLGKYSDEVEGIGVEPHVQVEPQRKFNAGYDPLFERGIDEAVKLAKQTS